MIQADQQIGRVDQLHHVAPRSAFGLSAFQGLALSATIFYLLRRWRRHVVWAVWVVWLKAISIDTRNTSYIFTGQIVFNDFMSAGPIQTSHSS